MDPNLPSESHMFQKDLPNNVDPAMVQDLCSTIAEPPHPCHITTLFNNPHINHTSALKKVFHWSLSETLQTKFASCDNSPSLNGQANQSSKTIRFHTCFQRHVGSETHGNGTSLSLEEMERPGGMCHTEVTEDMFEQIGMWSQKGKGVTRRLNTLHQW